MRALADEVLIEQVRTAFVANREVYGAPRIHAELAEAGVRVARKRVARLMRAAGIVGCHRRRRAYGATQQIPGADVAPDRVDRKFLAAAPNQLWVADVTYVPTGPTMCRDGCTWRASPTGGTSRLRGISAAW